MKIKLVFASILSMLLPQKVAAQPFQEVVYSPEKTVFTLFAPNDAKQVVVRIYDEGLGGKAKKSVKMKRIANEQWQTTVKVSSIPSTWDWASARESSPRPLA